MLQQQYKRGGYLAISCVRISDRSSWQASEILKRENYMIDIHVGFLLDELLDIDRYISLPSDVAFVSGSQQVGLGNSASDHDLYIVYREAMDRLKEGPKQFWLKNPHRRVDLERHSWDAIIRAAATVNSIEPTPAATRHVPFDAFDIYYRTAVGRPIANESGFSELTVSLDTAVYDAAFAAWSLWQAGVELARARQRLAEERPEAAFFSARLGLRHAVTASMARLGDGWPNPKWAFVKLARRAGRESAEYQRPWSLNGLGSRDAATYVATVTAYCEELGSPHLLPASAEAAVYAWRGEVFTAAISGGHYLVHGKRDVFELDEAAQYLCELIDGRTQLRAIVAAFGERFDLAPQVAQYRAADLLGNLKALGLVQNREEFVMPEEVADGGS